MRVKQGEDYVLFCLDGVGRSHVVAGDVTALSRRQGPGEPPVPFSVTQTGREGQGRSGGRRSATGREWTRGKKTTHFTTISSSSPRNMTDSGIPRHNNKATRVTMWSNYAR